MINRTMGVTAPKRRSPVLPLTRAAGEPLPARSAKGRSWVKLVRFVVSAGVLSWLGWRTDWGRLGQAFANVHIEFWLAAVILYASIQVVSGFRWQLLSRPLGFTGSIWRYTGYYFIGMFFNLFLPTSVGGDVVRAWYLDNRPGYRVTSVLSVLVDRASGLMVLLTIACLAVALCPAPIPVWIPVTVWGMALAMVTGVILAPAFLRWSNRFGRVRQLVEKAGIYWRHPGLVLATGLLSLVVQAGNVLLVWLIGLAMDAPVPAYYYWILVPMVSLLTLLPVSLNGMGIREASAVLLLAPLGVAEGTALCLAILWFSVMTAVSLFGGGVYLIGSYSWPKVQSDHGSIGDRAHQGRTG